jgi:hypothetical protein
VRAFLEDESSQRAQPRPNLDHVIIGRNLGLIDNPAGKILVVQKILTECFGW